jgi:hypothetical protein
VLGENGSGATMMMMDFCVSVFFSTMTEGAVKCNFLHCVRHGKAYLQKGAFSRNAGRPHFGKFV